MTNNSGTMSRLLTKGFQRTFRGGMFLSSFIALLCVCTVAQARTITGYAPDQVLTYKKTVDSDGKEVSLHLDVFTPPDHKLTDKRPAIVFFFGGGWSRGSTTQFHPYCEYLASRGMVAISAEYRIKSTHGTTPQECVKDGKSAIRWVRENAEKLGIDPDRIAAGGGSAGGHVAAATGTLSGYEEPDENLSISSKPNALVLYNAVFDNGPGGYGHSRVKGYWEDFSPLHNIDETAPPAIVFLGTADKLIPVSAAENYKAKMEEKGRRCDVHLYEGKPHGFFNYPNDDYEDIVSKTDAFLVSLGYLPEKHESPESEKE